MYARFSRQIPSVSSFFMLLMVASAPSISTAQPADAVIKFPDRALRFIVPFPPGAANDTLARAVGQQLAASLRQSIVIDNRAGAGGIVGTAVAAQSAADGYTIVLVPATHAINATLNAKLPYNTIDDFSPVALVATGAYLLVVTPTFPPKTVGDLIALAKARPGQINYGSAGIGNATHLIAELMKSMANINLTHVPYKGGTPALVDVMSGRVQMYFGTISATKSLVQTGKVRALAVSSSKRSSAMPKVPTLSEAGITGFAATGWWGILSPAKVPVGIVRKLNKDIDSIVRKPEMQEWLTAQGFEPGGGSSEEFSQFIKDEIAKWGEIVRISGAQNY